MTVHSSWWVLDFRVLLLVVCCAVSHDVPLRPREMVSLLEEGRRQYNLVQAKATMPSFGSCWKNAVTRLRSGCQHLDDRIQSEVALGFANCFLEGAGLPRHDCDGSDESEHLRRESCLKEMHDKTFIAYTEFFTHTQSMCFFIMSQVWHEETEKTIDRLSTSAADVARQLEASEELQEELLLHQRKSVVIQQELLDNGVSLGSMLHESRDSLDQIFTEFRASTIEQQRLLSMVFHHLSTLQSWIVGEVSWVDSIAFYIPSFAFVYFLTSAQRSASARIPGLLILLLSGLLERFVSYFLLNDVDPSTFEPVDIINERLGWWVWLVRRSAVAANTLYLAITLYRYRNREEVMHELLEQIRRQNEELLRHIQGEVTSNGSSRFNKSRQYDESDGLGYMPVLTSSSSSLVSTPNMKESPVTRVTQIRLVTVPSTNGVSSPVRRIANVSIPTEHSAFKPIREEAPHNSVEVENPVENPQDVFPTPDISTSTPRSKARKKSSVISESPVSTRYNLRRSKTAVSSPA